MLYFYFFNWHTQTEDVRCDVIGYLNDGVVYGVSNVRRSEQCAEMVCYV